MFSKLPGTIFPSETPGKRSLDQTTPVGHVTRPFPRRDIASQLLPAGNTTDRLRPLPRKGKYNDPPPAPQHSFVSLERL